MASHNVFKTKYEAGSDEMENETTNSFKRMHINDFDNTFSTPTWREDVTLTVEGKSLYVSSTVLSLMSPVFAAMFEDNHKSEMKFFLERKRYADVLEFLQCIYPNIMKSITYSNMFVVLPLAFEYSVEPLIRRCQYFLYDFVNENTKAVDICKCLQIISKCRLDKDLVDKYVCFAISKGIQQILIAENDFPLPLDIKIRIQSGEIMSLNFELSKTKTELSYLQYEMSKYNQSATRRYHFGLDINAKSDVKLKDARLGYIEYNICNPRTFIKERTGQELRIGEKRWNLLVSRTNDQYIGLYLQGDIDYYSYHRSDDKSSKVHAKFVLHNRNFAFDEEFTFSHEFTKTKKTYGNSHFIPLKTILVRDSGFLNDHGEVLVGVQFLVE